jgi:hypothetical protein
MCLRESSVQDLSNWNWDGEIIVRSSTVPSCRPIIGNARRSYDIDVRQFIANEDNSTIKKILREDIESFIKANKHESLDLFKSRRLTSFDYRVQIIQDFVSEKIKYTGRNSRDPWQFPEETFALKRGDCEDRAFLIASLIRASGVSPFNVRLVLGKVRIKRTHDEMEFDHIWVMYKNEIGSWILIEPLNHHDLKGFSGEKIPGKDKVHFEGVSSPLSIEYIPSFLFNDKHLWMFKSSVLKAGFQREIAIRREWNKFDPKFAGAVHKTIINTALAGVDSITLNRLNRYYNRALKGLVGPIIDDVDRGPYDPLDHFDNSLINEGWTQVERRLSLFKEDNVSNIDAFAYAAHAIADFYAHSSYVHFAKINQTNDPNGDYAELYDHKNPNFSVQPDYTNKYGFDLNSGTFTFNKAYWKEGQGEIAKEWSGKIISGRYAQIKDTWPDLISQILTEGPTTIPAAILNLPNFHKAGGPPHHNEIAVDDKKMKGSHILYKGGEAERNDVMNFKNQFLWRKNAAIRHIRNAFCANTQIGNTLIPFAH